MKNLPLRFSSSLVSFLLLVSVATPIPVLAATNAGVKPGSAWYAVDIFFEKVDIFFTFSSEKRVIKTLANADERLAEATAGAEEENPVMVERAMMSYQENVSSAIVQAVQIKDSTQSASLLSVITESTSKNQLVLSEVYKTVPESSKEAVQSAIAVSSQEQGEAQRQLEIAQEVTPTVADIPPNKPQTELPPSVTPVISKAATPTVPTPTQASNRAVQPEPVKTAQAPVTSALQVPASPTRQIKSEPVPETAATPKKAEPPVIAQKPPIQATENKPLPTPTTPPALTPSAPTPNIPLQSTAVTAPPSTPQSVTPVASSSTFSKPTAVATSTPPVVPVPVPVPVTPPAPPKDTTAPVISDVAFEGTNETSTTVKWKTNESATGSVTVTSTSKNIPAISSVTSHSVFIDGLKYKTTYSVQVNAKDVSGNESSATAEFTTADRVCYLSGCALVEDSGHQANPRIFGPHIIYANNKGAKWGLSYINLSTGERRVIVDSPTEGLGWTGEYDTNGTKIVYRLGSQIYLYDINTSATTQITNEDGGYAPTMDGKSVVWFAPNNVIFLYDITSGETKQITELGSGPNAGFVRPNVYGNKIVYAANRNGQPADIYLHDLITGEKKVIGTGDIPHIYGDYVVWSGLETVNSIQLYQISAGTKKEVGQGKDAQVYGDRVVYWSANDRKVHLYNISSGKETIGFGDGGGFTGPDIYEKTLVWGDQRNSSNNPSLSGPDIYFATLPDNQ